MLKYNLYIYYRCLRTLRVREKKINQWIYFTHFNHFSSNLNISDNKPSDLWGMWIKVLFYLLYWKNLIVYKMVNNFI